jgi:hypothetical protein
MESKDIGWGVNLDEVVIQKELGCRMYADVCSICICFYESCVQYFGDALGMPVDSMKGDKKN